MSCWHSLWSDRMAQHQAATDNRAKQSASSGVVLQKAKTIKWLFLSCPVRSGPPPPLTFVGHRRYLKPIPSVCSNLASSPLLLLLSSWLSLSRTHWPPFERWLSPLSCRTEKAMKEIHSDRHAHPAIVVIAIFNDNSLKQNECLQHSSYCLLLPARYKGNKEVPLCHRRYVAWQKVWCGHVILVELVEDQQEKFYNAIEHWQQQQQRQQQWQPDRRQWMRSKLVVKGKARALRERERASETKTEPRTKTMNMQRWQYINDTKIEKKHWACPCHSLTPSTNLIGCCSLASMQGEKGAYVIRQRQAHWANDCGWQWHLASICRLA